MINEITKYYEDKIVFTEEDHRYTFNGIECTSATTILGKLCERFDEQYHSKRIAVKREITQAEVLAEWKAKADKANIRGTGIHRYIECKLLGIPYDFDFVIPQIEIQASENVLLDLHHRHIEPYGVEVVMGSEEHLICGMADFIGRYTSKSPKHGKFVISDWKSNVGKDLINAGRFDKPMKSPLWYLKDSKNTQYSLQLSLYDYILSRQFDWWDGNTEKELYHIDGGLIRIPLEDYTPSIELVFDQRLEQLKGN